MQVFCGASLGLTSSFEGLGGGGINVLSSVLGLAAQANEMHRFFTSAWTVGSPVFRSISAAGPAILSFVFGATALPPSVAMGTKPTLVHCGLGELVRAGVVKPVSQVSSEERLKLLVMERLRLALCREATSPRSSSE